MKLFKVRWNPYTKMRKKNMFSVFTLLVQIGQIHDAVWTNMLSNLDKYISYILQIHFKHLTNPLYNFYKYILQFCPRCLFPVFEHALDPSCCWLSKKDAQQANANITSKCSQLEQIGHDGMVNGFCQGTTGVDGFFTSEPDMIFVNTF